MTLKRTSKGSKDQLAVENKALPKTVTATLLTEIETAAAPILRSMGLELVKMVFPFEDGRQVLRIFIDKELQGEETEPVPYRSLIKLDDCAEFSRSLSQALDELEAAGQLNLPPYALEVSSPGLDRPLLRAADFNRFTGHLIKIKVKIDGRNQSLLGQLQKKAEGEFALLPQSGLEEISFYLEDVVQARLYPEF